MIHSTRPIAVFGATGAQGGPVVEALLAAGQPVRALALNIERLKYLESRGAEVRSLDIADSDAVERALSGVAAAFVHLPFLPVPEIVHAQAAAMVKALVAANVPIAVFTLSGPAADAPIGVASVDTKALAKQIFSSSEAPIIGFEPTGYLGNLSAPFSAPAVVHHNELRYPLPAEHRQPWISAEDQASLAIAAFDRPDLIGRWFSIGEQLTGPELAAGISGARGRTIRYVPIDPKAFGESLAPYMGPEIGAAVAADYRILASRPASLNFDSDTQDIRRELGIPATSVADWARTQDWEAAASVLQSS